LANSVIVVTGAAGLMGFHHVQKLLLEEATVIAVDLTEHLLLNSLGGLLETHKNKIHLLPCDITSASDLSMGLAPLFASHEINGLVNNAAINPKVENGLPSRSSALSESWEVWSKEIQVGVYGAYNCICIIGEHMLSHGTPSSIVNISSDYGHLSPKQAIYDDGSQDPPAKPAGYSVVKHGVVGLTRYFATFWAGSNIRVNAIAPGGVENGQSPEFVKRLSAEVPLDRMARPEEFGGTVSFLLSTEASYINGQEIIADGGRSIW
jgi:NAD(P)-dependent dehydrogenase (short-subunit alcohol dehydrogenase family)